MQRLPLPLPRRTADRTSRGSRPARRLSLFLIGLLTVAATIVLAAEPAMANSAGCSIDGSLWLPSRCTTWPVQANGTYHFIDYHADALFGCEVEIKLIDTHNQNVVFSRRG